MDLAGVHAIIDAAKAPEGERCIILHGVHGEVQKVVELTELDRLPNVHVVPCTVGVS